MSFHGGLRRLSMASFTVHIRPYSLIFVHIRSYSWLHLRSYSFIFVNIRPYSSIYDTIYNHLRPFTSIYVHWRRLTSTIYDQGPGKPDSFQNTRIVSSINTRTPLYQILVKWIYYKGKSKMGGTSRNRDLINKNKVNRLFHQKHEVILWSLRSFWVGRFVQT